MKQKEALLLDFKDKKKTSKEDKKRLKALEKDMVAKSLKFSAI